MIHRDAVRATNGQPTPGGRPCAHCGRAVPQPYAATQLFRYCRDNEGECQRAARRSGGMHRVGGTGLGDHVARAAVVTERLEHVVDALNEALHANLSPAGVERQIASVRGDAAASVAGAHAQRDEARQEARKSREDAEQARREADAARTEADQARAAATAAGEQAQRATELGAARADQAQLATAERDAARRELVTVELARDQAQRERDQVVLAARDGQAERAAADQALAAEHDRTSAELSRVRAETARLQADLERSRTEAGRHNNRLTAAVASLREELARVQQKAYEQESLRTTAERRMEVLAVRLRAAEAERDAARAEVDTARFQAARIDEQVSNLASALARLGTATRLDPLPPAPAAWALRDQKSA